jgi:hypothetical protein
MCYTDYPLWLSPIPFEDRVNKQLPWPAGEPKIYHVELISYDGNKYAIVKHDKYGLVEFKAGYLYWHPHFWRLKSKSIPHTILNAPDILRARPDWWLKKDNGVVCI